MSACDARMRSHKKLTRLSVHHGLTGLHHEGWKLWAASCASLATSRRNSCDINALHYRDTCHFTMWWWFGPSFPRPTLRWPSAQRVGCRLRSGPSGVRDRAKGRPPRPRQLHLGLVQGRLHKWRVQMHPITREIQAVLQWMATSCLVCQYKRLRISSSCGLREFHD